MIEMIGRYGNEASRSHSGCDAEQPGGLFGSPGCSLFYSDFLRYLAEIFMPNLARKLEGCFSSLSGIGYPGDALEDAERRLRRVKDIGVCPMAMLYRDMSGSIIQPEKDWRRFQRLWARPALIYRNT
jgi:hypothetical protein